MGELTGLGGFVDLGGLVRLMVRLAIDLCFTAIIIQWVYLRSYRRRDHAFTCYLFNIVTLCLCVLLQQGPAELGVALTLFGVFGILRYRTEQIRSSDLTYLFIALGLAILNGIADRSLSIAELIATNAAIVTAAVVLEHRRPGEREHATPLLYDKLELLTPGRAVALADDIAARTGLAVVRVDVERIDLLRDAAELVVHYRR